MSTQTEMIVSLQATAIRQAAALEQVKQLLATRDALQQALAAAEERADAGGNDALPELVALVAQLSTQAEEMGVLLAPRMAPLPAVPEA